MDLLLLPSFSHFRGMIVNSNGNGREWQQEGRRNKSYSNQLAQREAGGGVLKKENIISKKKFNLARVGILLLYNKHPQKIPIPLGSGIQIIFVVR